MKMRQFRQARLAGMFHSLFSGQPIGQWLSARAVQMPDVPVGSLVEAFRLGQAQQAALYVVQRVRDHEIVGEFQSREDALLLVNKHIRQKKARLLVFQNGEPVLFADTEAA